MKLSYRLLDFTTQIIRIQIGDFLFRNRETCKYYFVNTLSHDFLKIYIGFWMKLNVFFFDSHHSAEFKLNLVLHRRLQYGFACYEKFIFPLIIWPGCSSKTLYPSFLYMTVVK